MHGPPSLLRRLLRPEYLLRPAQMLRRLARPEAGTHLVRLPWGLGIEVRAEEVIGRTLLTFGVYDLALTEALWRLADPDDVAVDAGANIGYASSVLAVRAGRVLAVEPHPVLAGRLEANVVRWGARAAGVEVHRCALDARAGRTRLVEVEGFAGNEGIARLVDGPSDAGSAAHDVEAVTLDGLVGRRDIGVLKLDVEEREPQVLEGAADLLRRRAIRDIVYEDLGGYPTRVSATLESAGYEVFALGRSLRGPRLDRPDVRPGAGVEPPNYLATREPARALARFVGPGWRSLR